MSALGEGDREVVLEALEELRAAPPPRDLAPIGCVIGTPGVLVLLVLPIAARQLGVAPAGFVIALSSGILLLVVGVVIWFSAPAFSRNIATVAAEAALRRLEAWDPETGDRVEALRAAALLVRHGYSFHGPDPTLAVDVEAARRRLGPMIVLVEAVEEVLLEEDGAHPLFTEAGEEG